MAGWLELIIHALHLSLFVHKAFVHVILFNFHLITKWLPSLYFDSNVVVLHKFSPIMNIKSELWLRFVFLLDFTKIKLLGAMWSSITKDR